MATPRDGASQKESLKHSPHPRRSRKLPGHLVEYEHDLPDPEESESSMSSSSAETDKEENQRWEKMEVVWGRVLETMNEMQVTIRETSGALTKRVEQLERIYKSRSPFLPQSHTLQHDRAESLPAFLQTPQPNSVGIRSYTTDQLNLLAPAARQDTRTPTKASRTCRIHIYSTSTGVPATARASACTPAQGECRFPAYRSVGI
ncbi:hypothetical protein ATANTOWER_031807 [Ataeniobius toweri]|uniref:Uncharacterized protein n=1 Tax=Ataeniobius toweri TaxID=208326 RepID=A0ABU7AS63_9TELE|nr:hypothetical protein [Ataeniobius toweri]